MAEMSYNILNLPEYQVLDGFHMTQRLNESVKKRPVNHFHALQPTRITLK